MLNGSFTFTPAANFQWHGDLHLKVNDGTDRQNGATVTITVAAVNDARSRPNRRLITRPRTRRLTVAGCSTGVPANDTDVDGNPR